MLLSVAESSDGLTPHRDAGSPAGADRKHSLIVALSLPYLSAYRTASKNDELNRFC